MRSRGIHDVIQLSIEECRNFVLPQRDYEDAEKAIRLRNIKRLYDLLDIMEDAPSCEVLSTEGTQRLRELPPLLAQFNASYFADSNHNSFNGLARIRSEYDGLQLKIANFARKWGYDVEHVRNALRERHEFFSLCFVKEPGKQTFHQHFAAEWLRALPFIEHLVELPSSGRHALYIDNSGEIISGYEKKNRKLSKSIDFKWEYHFKDRCLTFYATHKYTKDSGGSQDNQYKDVQEFHSAARNCVEPDLLLLSITDGPYYLTSQTLESSNKSKLEYLNSGRFRGDRNYATSLFSFISDTAPMIIKWLKENFDELDVSEEVAKLNVLAAS